MDLLGNIDLVVTMGCPYAWFFPERPVPIILPGQEGFITNGRCVNLFYDSDLLATPLHLLDPNIAFKNVVDIEINQWERSHCSQMGGVDGGGRHRRYSRNYKLDLIAGWNPLFFAAKKTIVSHCLYVFDQTVYSILAHQIVQQASFEPVTQLIQPESPPPSTIIIPPSHPSTISKDNMVPISSSLPETSTLLSSLKSTFVSTLSFLFNPKSDGKEVNLGVEPDASPSPSLTDAISGFKGLNSSATGEESLSCASFTRRRNSSYRPHHSKEYIKIHTLPKYNHEVPNVHVILYLHGMDNREQFELENADVEKSVLEILLPEIEKLTRQSAGFGGDSSECTVNTTTTTTLLASVHYSADISLQQEAIFNEVERMSSSRGAPSKEYLDKGEDKRPAPVAGSSNGGDETLSPSTNDSGKSHQCSNFSITLFYPFQSVYQKMASLSSSLRKHILTNYPSAMGYMTCSGYRAKVHIMIDEAIKEIFHVVYGRDSSQQAENVEKKNVTITVVGYSLGSLVGMMYLADPQKWTDTSSSSSLPHHPHHHHHHHHSFNPWKYLKVDRFITLGSPIRWLIDPSILSDLPNVPGVVKSDQDRQKQSSLMKTTSTSPSPQTLPTPSSFSHFDFDDDDVRLNDALDFSDENNSSNKNNHNHLQEDQEVGEEEDEGSNLSSSTSSSSTGSINDFDGYYRDDDNSSDDDGDLAFEEEVWPEEREMSPHHQVNLNSDLLKTLLRTYRIDNKLIHAKNEIASTGTMNSSAVTTTDSFSSSFSFSDAAAAARPVKPMVWINFFYTSDPTSGPLKPLSPGLSEAVTLDVPLYDDDDDDDAVTRSNNDEGSRGSLWQRWVMSPYKNWILTPATNKIEAVFSNFNGVYLRDPRVWKRIAQSIN